MLTNVGMPNKPHPYIAHLSRDERMAAILKVQQPIALQRRDDVWLNLTGSVMGQQLSTKVASVIRGRFAALYEGKPRPERVLETSPASLRAIGLSGAKVQYVQNIARFALDEGMDYATLDAMGDEEIVTYLTAIKGVGRWTVEMLLMFTLGREDVFSPDDLGIRQAMIRLYRFRNAEDMRSLREKMMRVSARWSPYRTYACMHLWRHKDAK